MRLFAKTSEHTYKGKNYELTLLELNVLQALSWKTATGVTCAVESDELDHGGGLHFDLDEFNRAATSLASNGLIEIDHYTNDETGHRRPPIVSIDPMPNEHLWRHYAKVQIKPAGEQELRHALASKRKERRCAIRVVGCDNCRVDTHAASRGMAYLLVWPTAEIVTAYLIRPADSIQRWQPVRIEPHDPTTHRTQVDEKKFALVVLPLHGRGNKEGQGTPVRMQIITPPANRSEPSTDANAPVTVSKLKEKAADEG